MTTFTKYTEYILGEKKSAKNVQENKRIILVL